MAIKKKYVFIAKERVAFDGTKFPDYISPTYKTKKQVEKMHEDFKIIEDKTCGGSATTWIKRVN